MTNPKHTKGPWKQSEVSYEIRSADNRIITEVGSNNPADYSLIAAAPELLEALKLTRDALLNALGPNKPNDYQAAALHFCEKAIAKAEGK